MKRMSHYKYRGMLSDIFAGEFPVHQYKISGDKLVELYLDQSIIGEIKTLPLELLDFSNLQVLIIQNFSGISIGDFNFSKLHNLRVLSIANNNLTNIPSDIVNCKKLTTLYIGKNKFEQLPPFLASKEGHGILDYSFSDIPIKAKEFWEKKFNNIENKIIESKDINDLYENYISLKLKRQEFGVTGRMLLFLPMFIIVIAVFFSIFRYLTQDWTEYSILISVILSILFIIGIIILIPENGFINRFKVPVYPFPKSGERLTIEYIPSLLSWLYSEDPIKELFSLKLSTTLAAKNSEVLDAIEFLTRRGTFLQIRKIAKKTSIDVEDIPMLDRTYIDQPQQKDVVQEMAKNKSQTLESHSIQRIIDDRRCCKMHGRLGDQYCNVCGRAIKEKWVIKS